MAKEEKGEKKRTCDIARYQIGSAKAYLKKAEQAKIKGCAILCQEETCRR